MKQYLKSDFDETYIYDRFILVNTIMEEDDNRKNFYEWGEVHSGNKVILHDFFSDAGSYTKFSDAITKFKIFIDNLK